MKSKNPSDAEFVEYLESVSKLILKISRVYCADPEERKDLVQEISIQLWRAFANYDRRSALSTWTYRIALNTSISYLRKTKNNLKTHSNVDLPEVIETDPDPTNEQLELLYQAIEILKPLDKALTILQLEGCSNQEIADVMGLSTSNISTRKLRIKTELKKYFDQQNSKKYGI